jgi:hypothetical protein
MNRALGILVASCAVMLVCSPARATTIFSIQPTTFAAPGSTGNAFDVVLTNSGPGSIEVGGFSFEVSVTNPAISLTGADFTPIVAPYIFAGNSFDEDLPIALNSTSGATLDASDTYETALSGVTLISGESLSLGEVLYNVAANASAGSFAVSFTGTPSVADANNLADNNGNAIDVGTFTSGTINIVPEPSSLLLLLAGTAALAGLRRRA